MRFRLAFCLALVFLVTGLAGAATYFVAPSDLATGKPDFSQPHGTGSNPFGYDWDVAAPGVAVGAPAGFGGTSFYASVNSASTIESEKYTAFRIGFRSLFGRPVSLGEVASISYYTKKPAPQTAIDWWLTLYTTNEGAGDISSWYRNRIQSHPTAALSLNAPADQWNLWSTSAGDNQLRFFTNRTGFTSENILWSELTGGPVSRSTYTWDFSGEEVMMLDVKLGSSNGGGTGESQVDAVTVTLKDGEVAVIDLGAVNRWVDSSYNSSTPGWGVDHFATIQSAIDAAVPGDRIQVAPGTYNENLTITKGISLIGSGKDVTFVDSAAADYTLQINGNASPAMTGDVVVQGITFEDTGRANWCVVETDHIPAATTLYFQYCGITDGDGYGWWDYHSHGILSLTNCVFSNVSYALQLEGWDTGEVTIADNEFTNLHTWIEGGVPDPTYPPVAINPFCYGTDCTNEYNIVNNRIHDYADSGWGVVVNAGYPGQTPAHYTNVLIAGNYLSNIGINAVRLKNCAPVGEEALGGVVNAVISGNTMSGCDTGLLIVGQNPGTTALMNNFAGNGKGVDNQSTESVEAANNWWGTSDGPGPLGPGSSDRVSTGVAYSPWLVKPAGPNVLYLEPTPDSVYVQSGETVTVALKQANLTSPVAGYQAFLSFDAGELTLIPSDTTSPYDPTTSLYTDAPYKTWFIFPIAASGNDIDLAAGILMGSEMTSADADLATLKFTAGDTEGITQITFRDAVRPTQFTDDLGNPIPALTVGSANIYIDSTPPSITCPGDISVNTDLGQCYATVDLGTATATDGLSGLAGDLTNDHPSDQFPTGTTTVTWTVSDRAGNVAACQQTVTVTDAELPTITAPADVTVSADAGQTSATGVDLGSPTTDDNCGVQAVTNDAPQVFPAGVTEVTWTVTDIHGNTNTAVQRVTVLDTCKAAIVVETAGASAGPFTRDVEITFGGDGGSALPYTVSVPVDFTNGVGTADIDTVPAGVNWTCITAKDRQHTLRSRTSPSTPIGRVYSASLVLAGGDLTDDNWVDILDFGVFIGQFNQGGSYQYAPYPARDADIDGDGQIWDTDFNYIQINFLHQGDGVCGTAAAAAAAPAKSSISVKELAKIIGMKSARKADINKDRVVDVTDVKLFAQGKGK